MLQKLKTLVLTKYKYLLVVAVLCVIPALGIHQLITGTLVNALLVYAILTWGYKKTFVLTLIPSLITVSTGLLFGPFSVFVIYFMPIIVIANNLFILTHKKVSHKNILIRTLVPSGIKFGALFLSAYLLTGFGVVPQLFLTTMGAVQFITAICGSLIVIQLKR